MNRFATLAIAVLAVGLIGGAARASGDYGCTQIWKLASFGGIDCGNRARLAPENDTRVNLFFLQRHGTGVPAKSVSRPPAEWPYPPAEWNERDFGRSFLSWRSLRISYGGRGDDDVSSSSRCDSLAAGTQAFATAMAANSRLTQDDRARLTAARTTLSARCPGDGASPQIAGAGAGWPDALSSASARAFLGYLQAADAFYAGTWDGARSGFGALQKAPDGWVAETAAYMIIRVELNAAQEHSFDEYGDFQGAEKTDQAAVARAHAAIAAYLKHYPSGRYAASAQGLKRRAFWLGGDHAGLARAYEALLAATGPDTHDAAILIQEIDNKLLFAANAGQAIQTPQLLAAFDLLHMRHEDDGKSVSLTADALAGQKNRFAGQSSLFDYLTAAHAFYVARDNRRIVSIVPAMTGAGALSPLDFSRQMLRGMALAALRDPQEDAHWRAMLNGARAPYQRELVELGLALSWQRSGRLGAVFQPGSPIVDPTIRILLLGRIAGPDLLRQVAGDPKENRRVRNVALFTLLHKSLATGRYADFQRDRMLIPTGADAAADLWAFPFADTVPVGLFGSGTWSDGYACPTLAATSGALARNPADPKARLCLADFWRLNGFDRFTGLDPADDADALGARPSLFPGSSTTRAAIYASILTDPRVAADDRAYALYRAIYCYAPSGINDCGGTDVPASQRRAWFQRLKQDHASSPWARQLGVYW